MISGMDTQGMVNQLMRAESMRMDRLTRRRQTAVWRQEDLRGTMTRLNDFRHQQTATNTSNTLMSAGVWNSMRSMATNAAGQTVNGVTITPRSNAPSGNTQVMVYQTAQARRDVSGTQFNTSHNGLNNAGMSMNVNQSMRDFLGEYAWTSGEGVSSALLNARIDATTARNAANTADTNALNARNTLLNRVADTELRGDIRDAMDAALAARRTYGSPSTEVTAANNALEGLINDAIAAANPADAAALADLFDRSLDAINTTIAREAAQTELNLANQAIAIPANDGTFAHALASRDLAENALAQARLAAAPYNQAVSAARTALIEITSRVVPVSLRNQLNSVIDSGDSTALAQFITDNGTALDAAFQAHYDAHADNPLFTTAMLQSRADDLFDRVADAEPFNDAVTDATDDLRDATAALADATPTSEIVINNRTFNLSANDTVATFMARVNADTQAGVIMSFDNVSGRFNIAARETGEAASIDMEATDAGSAADIFLTRIGFNTGQTLHTTSVEGRDARISVNGQHISQASNTFRDANGLDITLSQGLNIQPPPVFDPVTGEVTSGGLEINITTERNVDELMTRIREFVNSFNDMIRSLNAQHNTPRPRHGTRTFYDPLTDEQRNAMSDREVERWEERARTGLLHRDDTLRNVHQQMRHWVQEPVMLRDSTGNIPRDANGNILRDANGRPIGGTIMMMDIGITTGYGTPGTSEAMIGMLAIDEDQLRRALETNPENVQQLFTNQEFRSVTGERHLSLRTQRLGEQGIAMRMNDIVELATGRDGSIRSRVGQEGTVDTVNNVMSRQIREYDERIAQMQTWLVRRESHFFAMFNRMEQAMAQSHQQMDSLWAFGGM